MAAPTALSVAATPYRALREAEFRVLRIKPGRFDDTIRIDLKVHSINEPPEYRALSYCWGTEISRTPVAVNNHSIDVTKNLDEALRHLRSRWKTRALWIDALSIDQKNIAERSQQVQIMGPIYSKAAKVIVWLGPATGGSKYVMRCIRHRKLKNKSVLYFIHYGAQLLERPWFYRVWTLQEVLLATSDPIIMVGSDTSPFSHFLKIFGQEEIVQTARLTFEAARVDAGLPQYWVDFLKKDLGEDEHLSFELVVHKALNILALIREINFAIEFQTSPVPVDGSGLLGIFITLTRPRQASDPRDKIYGLLGLCSGTVDGYEILADYSQSVSAVFSRAMALMIRSEFKFGYPMRPLTTGEKRIDFEFPSWVPDFTYTGYVITLSGMTAEAYLSHQVEPQDLCPEWKDISFDNLPNSKPVARYSRDFRVLYTVGVRNGIINTHRYLDSTLFDDVADGLAALIEMSLHFKSYHDSVTMSVILRTISGPQVDSHSACIAKLAVTLEQSIAGDATGEQELEQSFREWLGMPGVFNVWKGRTLILTDNGQIGLTIGELEEGDFVAGLFGANFPFILRQRERGEGYTMVNVAWVLDHVYGHDFPKFDEDFDGDFTKFGLEDFAIY